MTEYDDMFPDCKDDIHVFVPINDGREWGQPEWTCQCRERNTANTSINEVHSVFGKALYGFRFLATRDPVISAIPVHW